MAPPPKLHGRAFYNSIGAPKHVLAPMVDQSEFAWRLLTRSFLPADLRTSILAYSPMLHAKMFADSPKYRAAHFEALKEDGEAYLDGNPAFDRPLIVQFCANDPECLLEAAKQVQRYCDAVDLNLGCPQGIAKRGRYGAFLQEDWGTIHKLIRNLHENLEIPVTAKMRVLETRERTLEYARMILDAGASIITVHGRQREQKGHYTGLADWSVLRYLRDQLPPETVMFANGNILQYGDIESCLEATGVDGVMSAEGNLYDPSVFAAPPPMGDERREYWRGKDGKGGYRADAVLRRYMDVIHQHVMGREPPHRAPLFMPSDSSATTIAVPPAADGGLAKSNGHSPPEEDDEEQRPAKRQKLSTSPDDQKNETSPILSRKAQKKLELKAAKAQKQFNSQQHARPEKVMNPNLIAMQAHCFHILRPLVSKHHNVRDTLARCKTGDIEAYERVLTLTEEAVKEGLLAYEKDPAAFENLADEASGLGEGIDASEVVESSDEAVRRCRRPYWVCQPYVRPLPKEALEKGSVQLSKKERRKLELEAEEARKAGVVPGGEVGEVAREVREEVTAKEEATATEDTVRGVEHAVEQPAEMQVPRQATTLAHIPPSPSFLSTNAKPIRLHERKAFTL
ncbi:tRNA dihydrouridine synthase [Friedmanniomyces endolithicus]|nr:tRNA dihydrouridine synthase [Friedmanniomyces endolithicus]KAK0778515.1 tRNA dihydrouridine synthase [Friedmanniomyces endolithicus]KAK0802463.1 tRNA dihydrouridine synthase [Friedmanniomyces endolithicus]KAK0817946.1 tRNA dihydrouridine synthase [Friedmanniomyces endolithicus]KAK0836371.1 tRNA dihydrouridine synthase [Friedmanniomyces endolithicus]